MDKQEYSDFMKNVYKWLPFELDECTFDRCRAWKSNPGTYFYNEADLLDPTPFIPKTVKNLKFTASQQKFSDLNLGNLERWFLSHIQEGSRNNMLHRYAMILKDMGKELIDDLMALDGKGKTIDNVRIAFQTPISVKWDKEKKEYN